ncbi:hypothetical protein HMPREF9554_02352 [Treponema phagedenis F0421]|nr:hypothetical protein HMPREF9554_02352 [Treponema phagedenis F0421]
MLKSAVPYCWCSDFYNRRLITKRYTAIKNAFMSSMSLKSFKLVSFVLML